MSFRIPLLAGALVAVAAVAAAQAPLQLQISNGRVTLHAQNVPVKAILAEWSKVGGAKVINGDGVAGAPLTLALEGVPERQALDIILRGVSGYMLAARQPGVAGGASMYDRIMILPTSVAPRNPPPTLAGSPAGIIRPVMPRQSDDPDASDEQDAAQGNDGVPLGRAVPIPRPVVGGVPGGAPIAPPVAVLPDGVPQQQPPLVVTPANPFGLPAGSSTRPGVITPPPQAQPPRPPDQD